MGVSDALGGPGHGLADYAIWQTNFGAAAVSRDPMRALVPEPGSLLFLGIGLAVVSGVRQRMPYKRFAQPLRDGARIAKLSLEQGRVSDL